MLIDTTIEIIAYVLAFVNTTGAHYGVVEV